MARPRKSVTVISLWRGYCLGWTGRLPEGLEELGRSRRFAEEDGTPETAGWSLSMAAQASYNAHDAERALASARKVEEISRALGNHPVLVALAQLAFGYAHLAAGRAADAIESARAALDIFGRVEKQMAGRATALLAEAILQTGDHSAALDTAQKAIAICRSSLSGSYEAALANAAELIERTGAKTLAPALCEWGAELAGVLGDDTTREQLLRQAQQGYVEIGALGHADRIAKELPA